MSAKKQKFEEIIRPVVEGLGYECWGIEYLSQGKHSLLRVFIERRQTEASAPLVGADVVDSSMSVGAEVGQALGGLGQSEDQPESESGIELKDCELVSRQLSGVLDVEDPIAGDYTLEVSSPGLDRSLYELSHYERFKGHHVAIKLRMPYEGRRKYNGVLNGVVNGEDGSDIVLLVGQEEFLFPLEGIEKANVVPQFD